jgi:hypothetical protein
MMCTNYGLPHGAIFSMLASLRTFYARVLSSFFLIELFQCLRRTDRQLDRNSSLCLLYTLDAYTKRTKLRYISLVFHSEHSLVFLFALPFKIHRKLPTRLSVIPRNIFPPLPSPSQHAFDPTAPRLSLHEYICSIYKTVITLYSCKNGLDISPDSEIYLLSVPRPCAVFTLPTTSLGCV